MLSENIGYHFNLVLVLNPLPLEYAPILNFFHSNYFNNVMALFHDIPSEKYVVFFLLPGHFYEYIEYR